MKRTFSSCAGFALSALLATAGCGKSTAPSTGPGPRPVATPEKCPLYFSGEGLCAALQWEGEPRSDRDSAFVLRFWKKGYGSEKGPYTAPAKPVAAILQMKSCGMFVRPTPKVEAPGVIAVRNIKFIPEHPGHPGDWRLFVQLGDVATGEKATLDFTIGSAH